MADGPGNTSPPSLGTLAAQAERSVTPRWLSAADGTSPTLPLPLTNGFEVRTGGAPLTLRQ